MRKSIISLVLSASLVCGLLPIDGIGQEASAADAVQAAEVVPVADAVPIDDAEGKYATSGTCGDNAEWFINSDATLVIHGSGILQAEAGKGWPWKSYEKDIQRVVVENDISLGDRSAFTYCENLTEAVFASTVTDLKGCLSGSNMPGLKDVWVYSADVGQIFSGNGSAYPAAGSGTKWHIYEGSTTEKSLREGMMLTDNDIEYITEDQQFPKVDRTPVTLPEMTDTSGFSGLLSAWKWDGQTQTLTFSGNGIISIYEGYYEKYKTTAKHIVIETGITGIDTPAVKTGGDRGNEYGAFSEFTALVDAELPDTLKKIGDGIFNSSSLTRLIDGLPENLESIGSAAFRNSSLSGDLVLPLALNTISFYGFSDTDISSVELHEGMTLGGCCFRNCNSLREVTIPGNIVFKQTPASNAMRSADTFGYCNSLEKVTIEGGGTDDRNGSKNALPQGLFGNCPSLKEVLVEAEELAYVEANGKASQTFDMTNNPTFKLYKGSTTETTLTEAGYLTGENTEYLAVDTTALAEAVARAEGIDTAKYTEESAGALDAALTSAKGLLGQEYPLPSAVKAATAALEEAVADLEEKLADYTAVDAAIAKADGLDLSRYTEESVKTLQDAIAAVDRTKTLSEQGTVDGFAKAIEDAIAALVEKSTSPGSSGDDSGSTTQPSPAPDGNGDDSGSGSGSTTQPSPTPGGDGDGSTTQPSPTPGGNGNGGTSQPDSKKKVTVKKVSVKKVSSPKKKTLKVTWKKVSGAAGYQVQLSTDKKFKKGVKKYTVKKAKTTKKTIKKLKSKKTYYARVRAYKTVSGKKYTGSWSKVKKAKVK